MMANPSSTRITTTGNGVPAWQHRRQSGCRAKLRLQVCRVLAARPAARLTHKWWSHIDMSDFADGHLANIIVQSSTGVVYALPGGSCIRAHRRKNKVDSLGTACDYRRNQLAEPCLGVLLCWMRAFVRKSKSVVNTCGSSRSRTHRECRHPFTTSTPKNGLRPRNPSRRSNKAN